ncbi:PLD-like domain protein [Wolbachia endosymbiont of Wuchereria bancrofti]|nr:PLD-like domain protein [Wolbachia endosymbiont of Wuchereria bancrofti]
MRVANSLVEAKKRGVDIKIILDKSQLHSKHSVMHKLFEEGIPIWIDYKAEIAHNRILIIDDHKVITGSFNLSDTAEERNAEKLLTIANYPEITE